MKQPPEYPLSFYLYGTLYPTDKKLLKGQLALVIDAICDEPVFEGLGVGP
jgi:hypothetical protein